MREVSGVLNLGALALVFTLSTLAFADPGIQDSHTTPSRTIAYDDFMSPKNWEPAGYSISAEFPGTTKPEQLETAAGIWQLPGNDGDRKIITRKNGTKMKNHMQYTVKTKQNWKKFHMQLSFRFDDDGSINKSLAEPGNSGIYIFGLYEIQIVNSAKFLKTGVVPNENISNGQIQVAADGKQYKTPANKALCGAVYGGGRTPENPILGAPTNSKGQLTNFCKGKGEWNKLDIYFVPAQFKNGKKTHHATVSVFINKQRVNYNGQNKFAIQQPTGSQKNQKEVTSGPIVLQDHGQKVSFKEAYINPKWDPGDKWAIAKKQPNAQQPYFPIASIVK